VEPVVVGLRWDGKLSLSPAYPDGDVVGFSAERVLGEIAEALFTEGPLHGYLCLATHIEVVKRGTVALGQPVRCACIVRAVRADESEAGVLQTVRVGAAVGLDSQPVTAEWLLTGVIEVQQCAVVTVIGRADGVADGVLPTFRTK
jgi:hypothetical protein